MKTKLSYCLAVLFYLVPAISPAQCTGGTNAGTLSVTSSWQVTTVNGGSYYAFNAVAGNAYTFSFCASNGGGNSLHNTQISILNSFGNPVSDGYNDDFCSDQSSVTWNCSSTGQYRVLLTEYNCQSRVSLGSLAYRSSVPPSCPADLGTGVITVPSLPYSSGASGTAGSVNDQTIYTVAVCGSDAFYYGEDQVYVFTPITGGTVTITLSTTSQRANLSLYQGCPVNGSSGTCIAYSQGNGNRTVSACLLQGVTYYVVIDSKHPTSNFNYTNLSISAPVSAATCNLGTTVPVASLPYVSSGRTTCGKSDNVTGGNAKACGNSSYLRDEDEVFEFTASSSGKITVSVNSAGSYSGLFLYEGCPLLSYCAGTGNSCISSETSANGTKSLCGYVTAGKVYYVIVDSWNNCLPYSISISAPTANFSGATCSDPVVISGLPFTASTENTACFGDDYNNYSPASSGTLYESGEDKVYRYTAAAAECIGITITGAASNSVGFQVYNGCPSAPGSTCIGTGGGATSGTLTGSVSLPSAGTYYIVVDSWSDPVNVQYNLSIISHSSAIINDSPCDAIRLTAEVNMMGDNSCSGGGGEPASPACWTSGNTANTVWYSFIAPPSGSALIRTSAGTLLNTQIAVYSGSCGNTMNMTGCNDNAASCGNAFGTTPALVSQLTLSGLTSGNTYYIAVDGPGSQTGTFGITYIDLPGTLPPLFGQECSLPLPVCKSEISISDPGFQSFGNTCDFPGGGFNCLGTGERGSVWYEIKTSSAGTLEFSIIPNDWPGTPSTEGTDYDFALWKTGGSGAVTCGQISSGSAPLRCNYSYLGLTGLYGATNGTENPLYPGFGSANQSGITVAAGETYLLVVSNYSNSVSGFTLDFSTASPVDYNSPPATVAWTGSTDTDWFKNSNWGGCPLPSCSTSAVILSAPVNQPAITLAGSSVNSLIINPSASLTINPSLSISVCGDITNNGTLKTSGNSTFILNGSGLQNVRGNLTGNNSFYHLNSSKTTGSVTLQNDIETDGNFNVLNTTSFNGNGKTIKLGGDCLLQGAFTPGSGGWMEFNGTGNQLFTGTSFLNNVRMVNTGGGVELTTDMNIGSSGILELVSGIISTQNASKVFQSNRTSASVSNGNSSSYLTCELKRALPTDNQPFNMDWPVGHSTKGFQRVNLIFYNGINPDVNSLTASFGPHDLSVPSSPGQDPTCGVYYNASALNNGRWKMIAESDGQSAFHATLSNTGYNNSAGRFTVMTAEDDAAWMIPAISSGSCSVTPVTAVQRQGISQSFTAGIPVYLATAQGNTSLPVKLLAFTAEPGNAKITLDWVTASESGNKGFEVLRSTNPNEFKALGWVEGKGNSNSLNNYTFIDKDVQPQIMYYYRLKQVDMDGKETLSPVVAAIIRDEGVVVYDVYPNPYKDATSVNYILSRPTIVTIEFSDAIGKIVKKYQQGLQHEGRYSVRFSAKSIGLQPGVYNVSLWCDNERHQFRITETE